MAASHLRYSDGSAELDALRAATEEVWADLGKNESLRNEVLALGLDISQLDFTDMSPFEIKPAAAGFEPFGTAILIGIGAWASQVLAGVAQEAILDLWRQVILPRIKDRLGSDAVGPEKVD